MPLSRFSRASRLRAAASAGLLTLLALVFVACGGGDDAEPAAGGGPATVAPAAAVVYGEALVRPSGDVEAGALAAIRRVLRVADPQREIRRLLDEEIDGERGLYSEKIEPWLGETVGGFLLAGEGADLDEPDGGILVAVRDRAAAERMLKELRDDDRIEQGGTVDGVAYDRDDETSVALVGEFLFVGTLPALRASVAASKGDALADSERFASTVERLDDDRLAWAWVDPAGIAPLLEDRDDIDPAIARALGGDDLRDADPMTFALTARADEIVLELSADERLAPKESGAGAVSLGDLPGGAWLALATPPLGETIASAVARSGEHDTAARALRDMTGLDLDRDVLGWIGGVAAFVRGSSPLDLSGGLVLGSSDADASQRFVSRLGRIVGNMGLPTAPTTGAGEGFQIRIPQLPQPVVVLAQDDRVALALGLVAARELLDAKEPFDESPSGKDAIASLGDGFEPSFVLVVDPVLNLLRLLGATDDPDVASAMPYLSAYRSLAAGTKHADGRVTARLVAALQDGDGAGSDGD